MRKITYLESTFKALSEYDKDKCKRIVDTVEKIPQGDIKRLQGEKHPPLYRLRIEKFRVIYHIENEEIIIAKIDTRGDVYEYRGCHPWQPLCFT